MNEGEISGGQSQEENKVFFSSSDLDASASARSMFGESTATMPTAQPTEAINTVNTGAKAPKKSILGGRSRSDAIKSSAAQAHPFVPNPNAPDFFNDAMRDLTPAPEPKREINKKPIIIGIIILLLLAVAGISAAVLLKGDGGGSENHDRTKIAKDFSDYLEKELEGINLQSFEDTIVSLYTGKYDIDEIIQKKEIGTTIKDGIGQLSKVKEVINSYGTKGFNADQKSKIEAVAKAIEEQAPMYEKIYSGYQDLYSAFHDKKASSIAKLRDNPNATISGNYKKLSDAKVKDNNLTAQYKENNCDGSQTALCQNISNQYRENDAILYDGNLVAGILRGYNDSRVISRDNDISGKISELILSLEAK